MSGRGASITCREAPALERGGRTRSIRQQRRGAEKRPQNEKGLRRETQALEFFGGGTSLKLIDIFLYRQGEGSHRAETYPQKYPRMSCVAFLVRARLRPSLWPFLLQVLSMAGLPWYCTDGHSEPRRLSPPDGRARLSRQT